MIVNSNNSLLPGGGIHHIAVQTFDPEASLRLYRDVLGMRIVKETVTPQRSITLLDIGDGSHVELVATPGAAPGGGIAAGNNPLLHIALRTTDLRAVIEQVRSAGYEITVEPKEVRQATIAFFKGPNAELIEFYQTY